MSESTESSHRPDSAGRGSLILRQGFWIAAWTAMGAYLAFALLILTVRYAVLPRVDEFREDIARVLSDSIGRPVTIGLIEAQWHGLRPGLSVSSVVLHDEQGRPALGLESVSMVLSWRTLLIGELRLHRIELDEPRLAISREANGEILVAGIPLRAEQRESGLAEWLSEQGSVVIRGATVEWTDRQRGARPLVLQRVSFLLNNEGRRHRFGLTAVPPNDLATRLDVRGDLRSERVETATDWTGGLYAELAYADLAAWRPWVDYPVELGRGAGGLRVWISRESGGKVASITADVALHDTRLRLDPKLPELDLRSIQGRLSASAAAHEYRISGHELAIATSDGVSIAPTDFRARWRSATAERALSAEFSANRLDLGALGTLAGYLPFEESTRTRLAAYAPRGMLADVKLSWQGELGAPERYALETRFDDLALNAQGVFPGLSGLSGRIEADQAGGELILDSGTSSLDLPAVLTAGPMRFDSVGARVRWTMREGYPQIRIQRFEFAGPDASGSLAGRYAAVRDGPGTVDLEARLTRANAAAAWRYVPRQAGLEVVEWLKEALLAGTASEARLTLAGDLRDFPFGRGRTGTFLITGELSGVRLRYAPDWPEIEGLSGNLRFEGARMQVRTRGGGILGASLASVSAEIPDLGADDPLLRVQGGASGPTAQFLRFIDSSPVAEMVDRQTEGMTAAGSGNLTLKLAVPLAKPETMVVDGEYRFSDNVLSLDASLPPLTDARGRLRFSEKGITVPEASARIFDSPLSLTAVTRGDETLRVDLRGNTSVATLRRQFDSPLLEHLGGSTDWRASIDSRKKRIDARFESDLRGLSSSLPEPLNKSATEALPLRIERTGGTPPAEPALTASPLETWRVVLGSRIDALLVARQSAKGRTIERGAIGLNAPARLPEAGVALTGSLDRIDADRWKALLEAGGPLADALALRRIAVKTEQLTAYGQHFHALDLRAERIDGVWRAEVASREVTGALAWNAEDRGRLKARLTRLALADIEPAAGAMKPAEEIRVDSLPSIDLVAEEFLLRGKPLGRLELMAANQGTIWKVEKLSITNPDGALAGSGRWRLAIAQPITEMDFRIEAKDAGKLLDRLGYAEMVKGGTAKLEGRAAWDGPPTRIHYPSLRGAFRMDVAKGQFAKLDPGVGRILGIVSLQALPRRVSLDFKDVFSEGFTFDVVAGNVQADAGVLESRDLAIEGPAAKVAMSGKVSLVGETQDLRVKVRPSLSETVAVGAALINPVIGAAALVAQKALRDPLSSIFAYEYAVTGSWADPKVEKVSAVTNPPGEQLER